MESLRQQKVARLLQKSIGAFFLNEGKSFNPGGLTSVTRVRVSPDLSVARIYLSMLGPGSPKLILEEIEGASRGIRFKLGKELGQSLRIVPNLHFFHDDSAEYAQRIDALLNTLDKPKGQEGES
jgi:ribosome-binding factor A